jgi:hypothetical protein
LQGAGIVAARHIVTIWFQFGKRDGFQRSKRRRRRVAVGERLIDGEHYVNNVTHSDRDPAE